jgi:proteasome-associated ATPase
MEHAEEQLMIKHLLDVSETAPNRRERARLINIFRQEASPEAMQMCIEALAMRVGHLGSGLREAKGTQAELAETIEKLTAPPNHVWTFRGLCQTDRGQEARVTCGGPQQTIGIEDGVDIDKLVFGDEVFLSKDKNIVMALSPWGPPTCGETALFDRLDENGCLIVKSRDEEIVADPAGRLDVASLKPNDKVRWDRTERIVYAKIAQSKGVNFFMKNPPKVTFDDIGGLDEAIDTIKEIITLHIHHRDIVDNLHLEQVQSILMEGPPGSGKTMLAGALANWLAELSGSDRSGFMHIKPGGPLSKWFGESENNIRELFRVARDEGQRHPEVPVIMFFDEVDSIGHSRGTSINSVDDRVIEAFMTELDGLEEMGNIIVMAATNRIDMMSEAVIRPGRLGDERIVVPRPSMAASRDIFARHLRADIPYENSSDTKDQSAVRQGVINAAVSAIFAPNGSSALAKITLRDNTRRIVTSSDLLSGAAIRKVSQVAVKALARRMVAARLAGHASDVDSMGIRAQDVLTAISDEFNTVARGLTKHNIKRYIKDLPEGSEVTGVEQISRQVLRPHKYMNLSVA